MDTVGIMESQAIDAAIANDWEKAINLNREILKQDSHNLGAHLRLGFALLQTSQMGDAAKAYKAALKIQPRHQLALDNLERIEILQKQSSGSKRQEKKNLDPNLFLDVPGKTKTVQLTNLGQKQHLADLYIGQVLELKSKKRRLEVRTFDGNYIGTLPDDISKRLIFFVENESVYGTFVKEASLSRVLIFIKEVSKGKNVQGYISFPNSSQPMNHPLQDHDQEDTADDDDDKDDDNQWDDDDNSSHEDDEEKTDLLHIHTESDDDDSEE